MAKKVLYKDTQIHLKLSKETKDNFKKKIKEKGFASITKAIGYANEREFGINTAK